MLRQLALVAFLTSTPALAQTAVYSVAPEAAPVASDTVATSTDLAKRMTVPVMVNGQGPFQFVIDTGSDNTVIAEELAERLGLEESGKAKLHAMSGTGSVRMVAIASMQYSNRTIKNIKAASLPAKYVGADGLLGIDSMKGQRIEMDFDDNSMKVVPSTEPESEPAKVNGELIIVTARSRLGQLILADADANGEKIWVVVDTGAQNTVGNSKLRGLLQRKAPGTQIKPIAMLDVLGQRTSAEYTVVDRVRIGGVAMGNTAVAFADAHPFRLFGLARKPSMLLGMDTLRAFRRVSVDFSSRKIKFLLAPAALPLPASASK